MDFPSLASVVRREHARLALANPGIAEAARVYEGVGGQGSWQAVGLHATSLEDRKLVLEVLHLPTQEVGVVRVYQEEPPEILFARKSADVQKLAEYVQEAASCFMANFPSQAQPFVDVEGLSSDLGFDVSIAFTPIPPPLDLAEISG
jgi:hypothetical protein